MNSRWKTLLGAGVLAVVVAASAITAQAQSRSVGQVIDDTAITTEVMAKLTADKLSNLTKIGVSTRNGVVTLNGAVDAIERQNRAVQIAASVNGVRGVVNNILVTAVPVSPPAVAGVAVPSTVDATGTVAQVDTTAGTVTLTDGRVLRATNQTLVWQPSTFQGLKPGAQVLLRGVAPVGVQSASGNTPEWLMGTVRSVDRASYQVVLTDGTVVRLASSGSVHRGPERLALEQIKPGSEVVIRTLKPSSAMSAEGSALPGPSATGSTIDASEINVVWMP